MEDSTKNAEQPVKNVYLAQVMSQQAQLADDLRVRRATPPLEQHFKKRDSEEQEGWVSPYANNVRITGWWLFKNVIIPPNVYGVHTRKGHTEPLHMGLGVSFGFDPLKDSYLIVPATMQTILISANCICREKQGLLVQGYVQWIIDDIKVAYKRLDFSDAFDPMRVVNVQLREQAEAAIKDKVATMSIDEVLTDKQPIIQELTARLRHVAEGEGQDKGLGLRIVTVQIKEAVVASPVVWEMLQRPFRSERGKEARLAELENLQVVREKEAEAEKQAAKLRVETASEASRLEAEAEAAKFNRQQAEFVRRAALEAESLEKSAQFRRSRLEDETEMARLLLEKELTLKKMRLESENAQAEKEIELSAKRRHVENELTQIALQDRLVQRLPEIVEKLPKPAELKAISLGSPLNELVDSLRSLLAGVTSGNK